MFVRSQISQVILTLFLLSGSKPEQAVNKIFNLPEEPAKGFQRYDCIAS